MKTGIVKDWRYVEHNMGAGHPESPERIRAVYERLEKEKELSSLSVIAPRPATEKEVALIHTQEYIEQIKETAGRERTFLDPDTSTSPRSYEVALLAAGGLIEAADRVMDGKVQNAFAVVRPPGHHAEAAQAKGFCIFNNAAIAAQYLVEKRGLRRILIVDWDLHHGNGTQEIFYEDRQVLYFSTHQSPAYPGTGGLTETGKGPGLGYTINVPLSPGADDALYVRVFRDILSPIALAFKPEIIMVSAGFDPYVGDPLGEMKVTPEGFACLTRILLNLADECCGGQLVLVLEGGYQIQGLTKSVRAVLLELLGETRVTEETLLRITARLDEKADRQIGRVRKQFEPHWPVL
jgi:acetoin utilization deacetylase AcuC-like enzyme